MVDLHTRLIRFFSRTRCSCRLHQSNSRAPRLLEDLLTRGALRQEVRVEVVSEEVHLPKPIVARPMMMIIVVYVCYLFITLQYIYYLKNEKICRLQFGPIKAAAPGPSWLGRNWCKGVEPSQWRCNPRISTFLSSKWQNVFQTLCDITINCYFPQRSKD